MKPNNTTALHIFTSLAFSCMVLLLWYAPAVYSFGTSYAAIGLWTILLPLLMIITGAYKLSLTGEDEFVLLKIIYLMVVILFLYLFLWLGTSKKNKFFNFRYLTIGMLVLIGINILLAVRAQFDNRGNQVETVDKVLDTWNPIMGGILALSLFYIAWRGAPQDQFGVEGLRIYSRLGWWYIMAYSLWDTVFRFQLDESTVLSLFIIMTIIVPAALYYMTRGWVDYAQFRPFALLFYIIIVLGIGKDDLNIFPAYNEQGINRAAEEESPITKLMKNETFKWIMFGSTVAATGASVIETYRGTKDFKMSRKLL